MIKYKKWLKHILLLNFDLGCVWLKMFTNLHLLFENVAVFKDKILHNCFLHKEYISSTINVCNTFALNTNRDITYITKSISYLNGKLKSNIKFKHITSA